MRIAIIDEELPYPPTTGKRIRTLSLTTRLAKRHEIVYVCHRNADQVEQTDATRYFKEHGIETVCVDRRKPRQTVLQGGVAFYCKLALNLASSRPYVVDVNRSSALNDTVKHLANSRPIDLWQCEWTPYAEAVRHVPKVKWIVMAHNVESVIWQRYHENELNALKRWYIRQQWKKFERYERAVFGEALKVVTVSDTDAQIAAERLRARQPAVVANGVDLSFFRPGAEQRAANEILFLGSLDWRPNLDAVDLLLDQIMPSVWKCEPSAKLVVVGRKPPPQLVARIARTANVSLHSDVPDVRPFLHRATLMTVPLRIGGGSRLKILESLACELPVLSTRVGAEGLHLVADKDLILVDDVAGMAHAMVDALKNRSIVEDTAREGRASVSRLYGWDALADHLEEVWHECLGDAPDARRSMEMVSSNE